MTIAKYAADQMILSKLQPNEKTNLSSFFIKRVFPIAFLFCLIIYFTNGLMSSIGLIVCIPIEVFLIITIIEFNVSKKYYTALMLNLIGYPAIFVLYIILSIFTTLTLNQLILMFVGVAFLKYLIAWQIRKTSNWRNDILIISPQVPVQQAGNYFLFRADQLFIATNLSRFNPLNFLIPADYLFYSKLTDLFSGIATSLGPILSKFRDSKEEISYRLLFKNKLFIIINISALLLQLIVTLICIATHDKLHLLMIIPFMLVTIMIVPVNMINYEIYRTANLTLANKINMLCLLISVTMIGLNTVLKSTLLFSFLVPLQLFSYIVLFQILKNRKHV